MTTQSKEKIHINNKKRTGEGRFTSALMGVVVVVNAGVGVCVRCVVSLVSELSSGFVVGV